MPPRFDPATLPLPHPLAPIEFVADDQLVARWASALGTDAAAADVLPPYPLTGCTIQLLAAAFDIAGGVYWREQVTYHRPVRIGERLEVAGAVEGTYVHDGRLYAVMASRTTGADGTAVASSRSTGLQQYRRGAALDAVTLAGSPDGGPRADRQAAGRNPSAARVRAMVPGAEFVGAPVHVTLAMMRALAGDDDRNPIHTDETVARAAGLRAPIAGGPHVLAFAQLLLMEALGPEVLSHGAHVDVRWLSPVYAGDTVTARATTGAVEATGVRFDFEVRTENALAMAGSVLVPLQAVG